jgi:4-amino-4-deoxy-L-arabinose transferase-like glycosyltransferase
MIYDARPFDARPTPARVSAEAAAKFPRLALWGLLIAYVLAGLFGRDPWPQDDAAGFGVMVAMAQALGSGDAAAWWLPSVAGQVVADEGPLAFWVGALFLHVAGPLLGDVTATRLTCGLWFMLAAAGIWYATYRLARRDEAQPIAFVFGGEANPRDYGRMLADIAALLFVGTVGIALRIHETSAEPAALAWLAVGLFGLAVAIDRPVKGAALAGAAFGLWAMTRGATHAPFVLTAAATALATMQTARRAQAIVTLLATAALVFSLWPILAFSFASDAAARFFETWLMAWRTGYGVPAWTDVGWIGRNLLWYTWPLWPLAGWTLYTWRHGWTAPHLRLPMCLAAGALLALAFSETPSDAALILLIPPLAVLAAFGAVTLRHGADDGFDWMAIVLFSLLAIVIWAYFVAMVTGTPVKMAASIARLTPGFEAPLQPLAVAAAAAATLGWIALVAWRVMLRPAVLWRGSLLAAGGTAMLWVVVSGLFMPAVDYNRSYAPLAQRIAAEATAQAGVNACFIPHRLTPAHLALFSHFGGLRFARVDRGEVCPLALHRDSRRTLLDDDPPPGDWQLVWEGGWPARPEETMRIYRRLAR